MFLLNILSSEEYCLFKIAVHLTLKKKRKCSFLYSFDSNFSTAIDTFDFWILVVHQRFKVHDEISELMQSGWQCENSEHTPGVHSVQDCVWGDLSACHSSSGSSPHVGSAQPCCGPAPRITSCLRLERHSEEQSDISAGFLVSWKTDGSWQKKTRQTNDCWKLSGNTYFFFLNSLSVCGLSKTLFSLFTMGQESICQSLILQVVSIKEQLSISFSWRQLSLSTEEHFDFISMTQTFASNMKPFASALTLFLK